LVRLRVGDEKTIPQKPEVPGGPIIQENAGPAKPARTFPDLIKSRYDEELFAYYAISQIARLSLGGELRKIGQPDLYTEASISPNGRFLLVTTIRRPFSYQFTYDRFPQSIQIWNIDGEAVKQVYEQPLLDQIPIARGAVQAGPRYFFWRAGRPASLCWVEAQDGGDPKNQLPIRDVLIQLDRPFTAAPETLARMAWRYGGTLWGNDTLAIHLEYWPVTKRGRAWLADPSGRKTNRLMYDLSYEDVYADPGDPVMVPGPDGYNKLLLAPDGGSLYLIGRGASEEGNRPFIDRLDLNTLKTTRLWRSEKPYYSRPARLLDDKASRVVLRRESPEEPSNYFVMKLPEKKLTRLTEFKNTQPQFTGIQKKIIRYKRDDGINLSATLYLPKGYKPGKGGRLPLMMWAYPQDYQNAAAAGQVEDTPYRFTWITPWSPVVWLLRGFAVMDDPSMPVVAKEGQESNDTFVEQLVSSARAAIQEAVRLGVADSSRVAVGGHSYGAFMAANLVTHSNLFRAGIAQSGAYNRTLTPFGFQYEDRDLWKAREVYINTSPFLSADSIHAPLLLVHGQADDNPGTYTMQSERYFEALKGLGKNSRLVLFPSEKHGYRARETWLHLLWEIDRWMKLYVIPAKTMNK
jgi:dipeptidyl aminopeptidase/acylaminoacyl peptidase